MVNYKKYPINLKKSKIVIAIAQLTGPLPDGKHKTVLNERETLGWQSLADMKSRLEKANSILDGLSKVAMKPDIVVFPEYSLPVQKSLPELQRKATEYDFIIVGGADSIEQPGSAEIFNQSPIIIPKRKQPIWMTKRMLSPWEQDLVDEPAEVIAPLLTWKAGGRSYWISTNIGMDFELAAEDFDRGRGLFLVPMYSSDVMPFLGRAEGLLRLPGGTVTVLCNCVGEGAKGQSSVVALNQEERPFQVAVELSATKEQAAVFEIDFQHLSSVSPTKKSNQERAYPLGRMLLYEVQTQPDGTRLQPIPTKDDGVRKRGVINPAIFDVLGKKMRMAFLNVPQYAEVDASVKNKEYEVLAILGKEDVMVTHLAADRYDMIFDVTQAITWLGLEGNTVTPLNLPGINQDNFPHFSVDIYYKVLGVPVSESDRGVFTTKGNHFPGVREIEKIFKLGQHWEDSDVTDEERTRFMKLRWVLDTTETSPGQINAVMTIRLQHARTANKLQLLTKFEEEVMPALMDNPQVTSLYRGTSPGLGIDYVLRLALNLSDGFTRLYKLIHKIHDLSVRARLLADSTTYIVVSNLATLSLPKAILVTNLPRQLKGYRDQRIIPHLAEEERVRMIYQSEEEQQKFVDQFRPIDDALEEINYLELIGVEREVLLRRLTRGLFNKNLDRLKEVHDPLLSRAERLLTEFVREEISEREFAHLKDKEKVPSQKDKTQMSYTERVRIVVSHFEETRQHPEALTAVKALNSTTRVRNAYAHSDWERLSSMEESINTLVGYCEFIATWKRLFGKDKASEAAEGETDLYSEPLTEA